MLGASPLHSRSRRTLFVSLMQSGCTTAGATIAVLKHNTTAESRPRPQWKHLNRQTKKPATQICTFGTRKENISLLNLSIIARCPPNLFAKHAHQKAVQANVSPAMFCWPLPRQSTNGQSLNNDSLTGSEQECCVFTFPTKICPTLTLPSSLCRIVSLVSLRRLRPIIARVTSGRRCVVERKALRIGSFLDFTMISFKKRASKQQTRKRKTSEGEGMVMQCITCRQVCTSAL